MPTTIATEQARIALVHREYEQDIAELKRKMDIRYRALTQDPSKRQGRLPEAMHRRSRATLALELQCDEVWHDGVIKAGCAATIEDDGSVRRTGRNTPTKRPKENRD